MSTIRPLVGLSLECRDCKIDQYSETISDMSNTLFNQWLDKQVVVYGSGKRQWCDISWGSVGVTDTHTARLVNITKIEGDR